jgi:hypothetical protein
MNTEPQPASREELEALITNLTCQLSEAQRKADALDKFTEMVKSYYYVHITTFKDGATSISAAKGDGQYSLTDDDDVPPTLLEAIEKAGEK